MSQQSKIGTTATKVYNDPATNRVYQDDWDWFVEFKGKIILFNDNMVLPRHE